MRRHTREDLDYDLELLHRYETEGLSQAELGAQVGISQNHLSHRLARGRRYREELRLQEERSRGPVDAGEDLPYVPLTSTPGAEAGHYYDLRTDECTFERGRIRIGNQSDAHSVRGWGATRQPEPPLEGQRLWHLDVNGGRESADPDDPEPESEKGMINSEDKKKGVVYVQH